MFTYRSKNTTVAVSRMENTVMAAFHFNTESHTRRIARSYGEGALPVSAMLIDY